MFFKSFVNGSIKRKISIEAFSRELTRIKFTEANLNLKEGICTFIGSPIKTIKIPEPYLNLLREREVFKEITFHGNFGYETINEVLRAVSTGGSEKLMQDVSAGRLEFMRKGPRLDEYFIHVYGPLKRI
ncbi:MAG: hypothetical protein NT030_08550 [Candidatus Saganbacteria bacterium]|nr:hypothetical protein [Candidatus Saganbacteria bacterium]